MERQVSLVLKERGLSGILCCDSEKAASKRGRMGQSEPNSICLCRSLEQRQKERLKLPCWGEPRPDPPPQAWEAPSLGWLLLWLLVLRQLGHQPSHAGLLLARLFSASSITFCCLGLCFVRL